MEERSKGIVDIMKTVLQRPECGVEGCSNDGWIAIRGVVICGDCAMRWQQIENEKMLKETNEILEKLKK